MTLGARWFDVGDMRLQFGCDPKTTAEAQFFFPQRFGTTPNVVVSPFWRLSGRAVGAVETLVDTAADHFDTISGNAHPSTYFVSWLAVGSREGVRRPAAPRRIEEGELLLQFGLIGKRAVTSAIDFPIDYPSPPDLQIAAHWQGSGGGVGHVETIGDLRADGAAISSDNRANGYLVDWIAVGGAREPHPNGVYPIGANGLIQAGRAPKTGPIFEIEFERRFRGTPVVLLSPTWRIHSGVGHAETLQRVDERSFTAVSGNAALDYSVSWLAIGEV